MVAEDDGGLIAGGGERGVELGGGLGGDLAVVAAGLRGVECDEQQVAGVDGVVAAAVGAG